MTRFPRVEPWWSVTWVLILQPSFYCLGECVTHEVLGDIHQDSELIQCFQESSRGVFQLTGMGCGGIQLLWCEQWMDVGGCGAWSGSWVDIWVTGESVQLGAQSSWVEMDSEVKLREILWPVCLSASELLHGSEVLQVFVVHYCVNQISWTFQIVMPSLVAVKNCQQFFIMGVIVPFCIMEGLGVEGNWADL